MNKLHEIWEVFNELLCSIGDVYICGGAVRDSLRGVEPKDYDVYVINAKGTHWNDIAKDIKDKLAKYPKVKALLEFHKSEPFLVESITYEDKEIQIMLRDAETIEELVDTFDWNVCLFAYGPNGIYSHPNAIKIEGVKPGGKLKLNKVTYPYSTLRRGYRFSERFSMQLSHKTVDKLVRAIQDHNSKWHSPLMESGGGI